MQLIRAINKSNKSNNNNNNGSANQTSSTSYNNSSTNKVVIVAPPTTTQTQSVSQNANNNNSASVVRQPSSGSPSVSLPPLKKRTTIVKQAVPPPPPPRKASPAPPARSKSNNHSSRSYCTSRIIVNVDRLQCLSEMTAQSGNLKAKKWLESVDLHLKNNGSLDEISIPDGVQFKSVKKLIETFTIKDDVGRKILPRGKRKVSDSSLVKTRVDCFNTLERKARNQSVNAFKSETDSGIEISSKPTSFLKFRHQFSRDGEFV